MKKTLLTILTLVLTVVIGAQVANAIGSLTPSGTAGDNTQYSLNDIYDKLTNSAHSASATSSPFTTPGSVSATFRTLTEIYNAIPAIYENNSPELSIVGDGAGSLFLGGVEDGIHINTNPSLTFQDIIDYDPSFVASNIKDGVYIYGVEGTYLSTPEIEWSTEQGPMDWDNAVSTCSALDENGTGWRLPTIQEYYSITDFTTYANATQVPGFQLGPYWSGTEFVGDPTFAGVWYSYGGALGFEGKIVDTNNVRCVR